MRRLLVLPLVAAALFVSSCRAHMTQYSYPAWGFRISFPSPPQATDKPAAADGTPHSYVLESESAGRDFAINANDANGATDVDQVTDAEIPLVLQQVKGGEATGHTYAATVEGLMGRQFDISVNGRPVIRVRVFLTGDRLYTLVAKSAFGLDDPAVDQFLYSFHTLPGAAAANGAPANAANAAPAANAAGD